MSQPFLFPYPHVYKGVRADGSILSWPEICQRCNTRPCETTPTGSIALCAYGVNYQRVDEDMLVAGVVLASWPTSTQARKKRRREAARNAVSNDQFTAAVEAYKQQTALDHSEISEEKKRLVQEYAEQEAFKPDFLKQIKEDVLRGLAFVHDYKQINAQISQNINVLVESRYQGANLDEKLEKAHQSEKAIYEASKFLEEKLNVSKFLVTPDWLTVRDECVKFRVHGLVIKYLRIYQSWFNAKNIKVRVTGTSHNEIVANPQACGVIPHTLLDNALKYGPKGGDVEIYLQDDKSRVSLSVSSHGPRILPEESKNIFYPFFRGKYAQLHSEEGAGYGLYLSQLVAKEHLGTEIIVSQSPKEEKGMGFRTVFEVMFPDKARILS